MIACFDTETTGKFDFKAPINAPHQPRIVQLAALLIDDSTPDHREIMSMNVIVRPEGFMIPEEASNIHGITTEYANRVGIPIKVALSMFARMRRSADAYLAHNIEFDRSIIMSEMERAWGPGLTIPKERCMCSMLGSKDLVKLPGRYGDYKFPKLSESYKFAFGEDFEGAHNAINDLKATVRLHFWILEQMRKEKEAKDAA